MEKINKANIAKYTEEAIRKTGDTVCITKGNTKLGAGIYTYSTLPGDAAHLLRSAPGEVLCSVPGTCTGHCEACFKHGCYAVNAARRYAPTVIPAWGRNTLLKREGRVMPQIDKFIAHKNATTKEGVKMFRINVSGEIEDCAELEQWDALARKYPKTQFGLYTKNYEALAKFLEKHGETAPNFVINVSQWHGEADKALADLKTWISARKVNVFEYDDTNRKDCTLSAADRTRLAAAPHCPAVLKSGHRATTLTGAPITCTMCGRCYRKTGINTAVYAH